MLWCALLTLLSGAIPARASLLQFNGNLAFTTDAQGRLRIFDVATGTNVTLLTTYTNANDIRGLALFGSYVALATGNEGLVILDVSTPTNPKHVRRFASDKVFLDVGIAGDLAFLADANNLVTVLDIVEPQQPHPVTDISTADRPGSLQLTNDYLYVASGTGGLEVYDAHTPEEWFEAGVYLTPEPARLVRVAGTRAYVVNGVGRLDLINVQNPAAPALLGSYFATGFVSDLDVAENYVVLVRTNGMVTVLSAANPAAPTIHSSFNVPGGAAAVRLSGGRVFVRTGAGTLVVLPLAGIPDFAPRVISPVSAATVVQGANASFNVVVAGSTPLQLQWYRNGVALTNSGTIQGATLPYLKLTGVDFAVAGIYSVVISNAQGAVASSNTLTVVGPGTPLRTGQLTLTQPVWGLDSSARLVYTAPGTNGLNIYDIANPRRPDRVGGTTSSGPAQAVRLLGELLFLALGEAGLEIFSVINSDEPLPLSLINTPGFAHDVEVQGGWAYVADGDNGLQIVNISDPLNPILGAAYDTPGSALGVQCANSLVFVADGAAGIRILNATNPIAGQWLGSYDTPGVAWRIRVVNQLAYVADGPGGLTLLDISNPATPVWVATYTNAGAVWDVQVFAGKALLAKGSAGLELIDVSNPANPQFQAAELIPEDAWQLQLYGTRVTVAAGAAGIRVLQLAGLTATRPEILVPPLDQVFLPTQHVAFSVIATGAPPLRYQWYKNNRVLLDSARVAGAATPQVSVGNLNFADSGNYTVEVRNEWNLTESATATLQVVPVGTPVFRSGFFDSGDALNVQLVGNLGFLANRTAGLQIIDCSNPQAPVLVAAHPTWGLAQDVQVRGRYAYVATWAAGLEIFDILNPAFPKRIGHCDTPGLAHHVRLLGDIAYIADRAGGLTLVDVRQPNRPMLLGTARTSGFAEGVAPLDQHVFVAAGQAGLQTFSVTNPLAPQWIGGLDTIGTAESITVVSNRAYVADHDRGLDIINVQQPGQPLRLGGYQSAGDAFQVQILGSRAYIAEGIGRVAVLDISNATAPQLITTSLAGDSVRGLQVMGQHAFLADRESGLLVAELLGFPPAPPAITEFSESQEVVSGNELILTVAVTGTPPFNYSWRRNGITLTNQPGLTNVTAAHLHFPSFTLSNSGNYSVIVSNPYGSVTSAIASVTSRPLGFPAPRALVNSPGLVQDAVMVGNYGFIAVAEAGIQIVNFQNPAAPQTLGTFATPGPVLAAVANANWLYLALGTNGVAILSIANPAAPELLAVLPVPGVARQLWLINQTLYVAAGPAGLRLYDVSQPTTPMPVGSLLIPGDARSVQVLGSHAYVAAGVGGLQIVNVSIPTAPASVGSFTNGGFAHAVRVAGHYAYLANGNQGLTVLNVQNPTNPTLVNAFATTDAIGLDVAGTTLVLADSTGIFLVFDVSNPADPSLISDDYPATSLTGAKIFGNLVFVKAAYDGVIIAELAGLAPLPPTFVKQPVSLAISAGGVAQFEAQPAGAPPLTWRWYFQGYPLFDDHRIVGAGTTRLTISNITFADAGDYQLRVYSPGGVTNSAPARLSFISPLQEEINALPSGSTVALPPGQYSGSLVITQDLTLTGAWWNPPTLTGGGFGPALHVLPGAQVTLRGLALRGSAGGAFGGGIRNEGELTLEHCLVADNTAINGGGIANLGILHLQQSVISNNLASGLGGGIYNSAGARLTLNRTTVIANQADAGGGSFNLGTNEVRNSLFAHNSAYGAAGRGGGYYQAGGSSVWSNPTFSGNRANRLTDFADAGSGGGIYLNAGRADFEFATITRNRADVKFGGGVVITSEAELHLRNSIVADNSALTGPDISGFVISGGHNLVGNSTSLGFLGNLTGNLLNIAAHLGPLQDNGGPTLTHAPLPTSPAIDAGAAPGPNTDTRTLPRFFDIPWRPNAGGGAPDLGAVEFIDASPYLIVSNRTATGFTLTWAANDILQYAPALPAIWQDQINSPNPLQVNTATGQGFYRLRRVPVPMELLLTNRTAQGFSLAWPDYGILEHAPTLAGPWSPLTGISPFTVQLTPGENEFFRLRVPAY
jgi:hypothetical protein